MKRGQHDVDAAAAMLAVITGMGYGYQRPDGVVVIPAGALAPYRPGAEMRTG